MAMNKARVAVADSSFRNPSEEPIPNNLQSISTFIEKKISVNFVGPKPMYSANARKSKLKKLKIV